MFARRRFTGDRICRGNAPAAAAAAGLPCSGVTVACPSVTVACPGVTVSSQRVTHLRRGAALPRARASAAPAAAAGRRAAARTACPLPSMPPPPLSHPGAADSFPAAAPAAYAHRRACGIAHSRAFQVTGPPRHPQVALQQRAVGITPPPQSDLTLRCSTWRDAEGQLRPSPGPHFAPAPTTSGAC